MATASDPLDPFASGTPTGTPTHPTYALWAPVWRKLVHVYNGSGGFLDGTYLVAHPREWVDYSAENPITPTKKLKARRKLARYENIGATILDQKRSALFREGVSRTVGEPESGTTHPLEEWWDNVDGNGTCIDDWMAEAWTSAGLFGHVVHVMDRPQGMTPVTKADEKWPYLRLYSPLDMTDWLTDDRGRLIAVRLLEHVQRKSIEDAPIGTMLNYRERIIDETEWKIVRNSIGEPITSGKHGFGTLPVVLHYAKRRALIPVIGQSVLNDPNLFQDVYNLTSEIRELLRLQTFGALNVPLGTGEQATSIEIAKGMLSMEGGAENVYFSPLPMAFIQPDTTNVTVYQEERSHLLRTIFRLCSIPWEADSKDAESEGSLKLKREDMNQILSSYADECERTEYAIVELWFRATYGDSWQKELDTAKVVIRYPETFDVTPFAEILQQAQAALSLPMGGQFMAELCQRLVVKFLPDAPDTVVAAIAKEIEEIAKEQSQQERDKKRLALELIANPKLGKTGLAAEGDTALIDKGDANAAPAAPAKPKPVTP